MAQIFQTMAISKKPSSSGGEQAICVTSLWTKDGCGCHLVLPLSDIHQDNLWWVHFNVCSILSVTEDVPLIHSVVWFDQQLQQVARHPNLDTHTSSKFCKTLLWTKLFDKFPWFGVANAQHFLLMTTHNPHSRILFENMSLPISDKNGEKEV
jgi:hypothetical protein